MRTMLFIAAILSLMGVAAASDCTTWWSANPEFDVRSDATGHRYYVDFDFVQPGCCFSVWIYEESNGIDGLQRADELFDTTCHGMIAGDTIIF